MDVTARKKIEGVKSILHLYMEFKSYDHMPIEQAQFQIEEKIQLMQSDLSGLEEIMGSHNFRISALPCGAFNNFMESQKAAGTDLAHLKPPYMQPKEHIFDKLVNLE